MAEPVMFAKEIKCRYVECDKQINEYMSAFKDVIDDFSCSIESISCHSGYESYTCGYMLLCRGQLSDSNLAKQKEYQAAQKALADANAAIWTALIQKLQGRLTKICSNVLDGALALVGVNLQ